jgi:hypothetical protein
MKVFVYFLRLTSLLKEEHEAFLTPESSLDRLLPIRNNQGEGICLFSLLLFF